MSFIMKNFLNDWQSNCLQELSCKIRVYLENNLYYMLKDYDLIKENSGKRKFCANF